MRFAYAALSMLRGETTGYSNIAHGQVEAASDAVAKVIATAVAKEDIAAEQLGFTLIGVTVIPMDDLPLRNTEPPLCPTCGDLASLCDCLTR